MIRRTPLRRCSKKKAKENAIYMKLRKEFLETHPHCEHWMNERGIRNEAELKQRGECVVASCPLATEVHHKMGRGKYFLDTSTWMAVRAGHAIFIHQNLSHSRKMGYIIDR